MGAGCSSQAPGSVQPPASQPNAKIAPLAPQLSAQAYQGQITRSKDGLISTLVWFSATLTVGEDGVAVTDVCIASTSADASAAESSAVTALLGSTGESQPLHWGAADRVISIDGVWSGALPAYNSQLTLTNAPLQLTVTLQPQPFRYHFALIGNAAECQQLAKALCTRMNALCKPESQLRFGFAWAGTAKDRAAIVADAANTILFLTPNVWASGAPEDVRAAEAANKTVLLLYKPAEGVHVKSEPLGFRELEVGHINCY